MSRRSRQPYVSPTPQKYSEEELERMKENILAMDQYSMASLQRFAAVGHPYFRHDLPLYEVFATRFKELGGMTPEISKSLGWSKP